MEARGLITAEWGLSENNRRAKFYRLTADGRRALRQEAASWQRYVAIVARVLSAAQQPA
jgi:DNA-binding PadR family transcriptional regulator